MFEFEIIATGYTLAVATASVCIAKFLGRKKFHEIYDKLATIQNKLHDIEVELKRLKMDTTRK